jgi:hypothetical protein
MARTRIAIDVHSNLLQLDSFKSLMKGHQSWNFTAPYRNEYPGIEHIASGEMRRREAGLEVYGKKLFDLGILLEISEIEVIPLYLRDFFSKGQYWIERNRLADVLRVLDTELAVARTQQSAFDEPELSARESVPICLGVTDIIIGDFTLQFDRYATLAGHLKNNGKLYGQTWHPLRDSETVMAEDAEALGIDPGPLRTFIETRDRKLLVKSLEILRSLRDAILRNEGLSTDPIQPGYRLKSTVPSEDPFAPYLPASEIHGKYGILPGTLRQAKHRKQIHTIKPCGIPLYSLPDCKRKWPQDFSDEL